jgi:hypothetical protein
MRIVKRFESQISKSICEHENQRYYIGICLKDIDLSFNENHIIYDLRTKTLFGSSLPPVVSNMTHVLYTLFLFVCV